MRYKHLHLILVLLLLIAGCGQDSEKPAKVFDLSLEVLRVDSTSYTLADLNAQLDMNGWREHAGLKRIKDTVEFNFRAIEDLVIEQLVSEKALTFSIDTIVDAQKRMRDHMQNYVLKYLYSDLVMERVKITPEDVDTAYENNKMMYFTPESARAGHILSTTNPAFYLEEGQSHTDISKDSVEEIAREKMAMILEKLEDGDSFEDLAKEFSDDQNSGKEGGSLGWIQRGQSPPVFDSVLFSLQPGETSPAIKTQHGYHVVKCYERTDSSYMPLDDALRANIEQRLMSVASRDAGRAYLDSLRTIAKVRYNERLLKKPDSTYKPTDWLAIIDGTDSIFVMDYSQYARTYQMKNRIAKMDVEKKKIVLETFISSRILAMEARKLGYYDRLDIVAERDNFEMTQRKHQIRLQGNMGLWEPSKEEIKAYYDSHIDDYYAEKPLHVQHILFEDSLKAEKIRREIEDGADFREMALEYYPGDEDVRASLFDLGYISSDEMPSAFWRAAWILSPGDVSRPIKTEYGFHLIRLVDRKPVMSFEDAQHKVKRRMLDEKREAIKQHWKQELMGGHEIVIDSALVSEFVYQEQQAQ